MGREQVCNSLQSNGDFRWHVVSFTKNIFKGDDQICMFSVRSLYMIII